MIADIAKFVARHLETFDYGVPVVVEPRWVPLTDVGELKGRLLVQVIPENYESIKTLTRGRLVEYDATLAVFISAVVDFRKFDEVAGVVAVFEEVVQHLRALTEVHGFSLLEVRPDPLVDHTRLADARLYLGRIEATYRGSTNGSCQPCG